MVAEWQADIWLFFLSFSSRRLRLPLNAIKGVARMSLKAIKQKSFPFSVFRFPFFANFAKIKSQWLMANS